MKKMSNIILLLALSMVLMGCVNNKPKKNKEIDIINEAHEIGCTVQSLEYSDDGTRMRVKMTCK